MNLVHSTVAIAFYALIAVPAHADSAHGITSGLISVIDVEQRRIELADGRNFSVTPKVKLSKRRVGEKVLIIFEGQGQQMKALKVRQFPERLKTFE